MKSTLAILALSGLSAAAPLEARKEAISTDVFNKLELFSQYSAAAYCKGNNDSPNTKITCTQKNCAEVEAANTTTLSEFENSIKTDATGFVAVDTTNQLIVISFRGSKSGKNWAANVDIGLSDLSACSGCKAHSGFKESWTEAEAEVTKALATAQSKYPKYKIVATGHSLGGAMASIAAATLRANGTTVDLYTYGAPKSGNDKYAAFLEKTDKGASFRVVHKADVVPALPPTVPILSPFEHMFPEYYVSSATEVTVKQVDVSEFAEGEDTGDPSNDIAAHKWYFGPISSCANDD